MRPRLGFYRSELDQVRAVAIVLVVIWHFAHLSILPFGTVHSVILSFLTEGHNGVALCMVLSGDL